MTGMAHPTEELRAPPPVPLLQVFGEHPGPTCCQPPTWQVFSPEAAGSGWEPRMVMKITLGLSHTHRRHCYREVRAALCACPLWGPLIKTPLTASEPGTDSPVFRPGDREAQKEGTEMHPDLSAGVSHLVALAPQLSPIPHLLGEPGPAPPTAWYLRIECGLLRGPGRGSEPQALDRWSQLAWLTPAGSPTAHGRLMQAPRLCEPLVVMNETFDTTPRCPSTTGPAPGWSALCRVWLKPRLHTERQTEEQRSLRGSCLPAWLSPRPLHGSVCSSSSPHTPESPAGTQLGPGKAGQGGEVDKGQHRYKRAQVTAACPLGLGVTCPASHLSVQKARSSTLQSRHRVPGAPVGVREPQGGVPGTQLAWPCELGVTMERGRRGGDPDPKRVCQPWEPPFSDPETTPPPAFCPAVCCPLPRALTLDPANVKGHPVTGG